MRMMMSARCAMTRAATAWQMRPIASAAKDDAVLWLIGLAMLYALVADRLMYPPCVPPGIVEGLRCVAPR